MIAGTPVTFLGVLGGISFIILLVFWIMLVGKLLADVLFAIDKWLDEPDYLIQERYKDWIKHEKHDRRGDRPPH